MKQNNKELTCKLKPSKSKGLSFVLLIWDRLRIVLGNVIVYTLKQCFKSMRQAVSQQYWILYICISVKKILYLSCVQYVGLTKNKLLEPEVIS